LLDKTGVAFSATPVAIFIRESVNYEIGKSGVRWNHCGYSHFTWFSNQL